MSERTHVLDSSALLCIIFDEKGIDIVRSCINGAIVSAVNLAEVITKLHDQGMPDTVIENLISAFKLKVVVFDEILANKVGGLRKATRSQGLSLGDRACLALAIERDAIAVTTDRAWSDVECGARILVAR